MSFVEVYNILILVGAQSPLESEALLFVRTERCVLLDCGKKSFCKLLTIVVEDFLIVENACHRTVIVVGLGVDVEHYTDCARIVLLRSWALFLGILTSLALGTFFQTFVATA